MKVLLDIPKEFEADYNTNRFVDFFQRCLTDMGTCCGNYAQETAEMMEKAFAESQLYNSNNVLDRLWDASFERFGCDAGMGGERVVNLDDAIEIVKAAGNADLLMDRAKSKKGERIPYDGNWK